MSTPAVNLTEIRTRTTVDKEQDVLLVHPMPSTPDQTDKNAYLLSVSNFVSWLFGGNRLAQAIQNYLVETFTSSDESVEITYDPETGIYDFSVNIPPAGGQTNGQYFTIVGTGADPTANGLQLTTAYNAAKTAGGWNANSQYTILCSAGVYDCLLTLDTPFINVVSLSGERDVLFRNNAWSNGTAVVAITANNVRLHGIDVGTSMRITVATNLPNITVEKCRGGSNSFGGTETVNGTFIDCEGGNASFAGIGGVASGTFIRCKADGNSFGGNGGSASGTFIECVSLSSGSFGGGGTASGKFQHCTSGDLSFGGLGQYGAQGNASGVFLHCTGGVGSFGGTTYATTDGKTRSASGMFIHCEAPDYAFGKGTLQNPATATGKFYNCRLTQAEATFQEPTGAGVYFNCLTGSGAIYDTKPISVPLATTAVPGAIRVGDNLFITAEGLLSGLYAARLIPGATALTALPYYNDALSMEYYGVLTGNVNIGFAQTFDITHIGRCYKLSLLASGANRDVTFSTTNPVCKMQYEASRTVTIPQGKRYVFLLFWNHDGTNGWFDVIHSSFTV